jgi:hypothetical protein
VSFAFQGSRAQIDSITPWGPFVPLGGQAVFLLPWLWLPLVGCLAKAFFQGSSDARRWLMACLAIGPILTFTVLALRDATVLHHWAMPGYLMLFPLLGAEVAAAIESCNRYVWPWLIATVGSLAIVLIAVVMMANLPWPAIGSWGGGSLAYPLRDSLDWKDLARELQVRGFADRPRLFIAAMHWHEAGKIDYALGGRLPVVCLCSDPRGYGILMRPDRHLGEDALIINRKLPSEMVRAIYSPYFERIEEISPIVITHAGEPAFVLSVHLGHALRASAQTPNLLDALSLRPRQGP